MKLTDEAVEALSVSLIGAPWATFDEGLRNTLRAIHREALEAALPHLTDDGAAAPGGAPGNASAFGLSTEATPTAAPSSPPSCGHEPLIGLYDDTRTLTIEGSVNHEVAVKLGDEEVFFTWADSFLAAAHCAAYEAGEDATPAIDREALEQLLREHKVFERMPMSSNQLVIDRAELADEILALIEGAS